MPFIIQDDKKKEDINYVQFGICDGEGLAKGNAYLEDLYQNSKCITVFDRFGDGAHLNAQLQAVRSSSSTFKILLVNPRQIASNEMRDFIAEENCAVCMLPSPGVDYFASVLDKLIKNTGFHAPGKKESKYIIYSLRQIYGCKFSEIHILSACKDAIRRASDRKSDSLTYEDFLGKEKDRPVEERIKGMVGLGGIKKLIPEFKGLLLASVDNPALEAFHRHMIFSGDPGTGKTMVARLLAELLKEVGVGNGVFVEADRSTLIGRYIGHTAPKIRTAFEAARGGILFVDEAGFFLTGNGDRGESFTREALKEFVRYMENYPDVIVIFAMYDREKEEFLKLDEGLSSRIARKIHFDNYTADELVTITKEFVHKYGYTFEAGLDDRIGVYIEENLTGFGNARGARNLAEALIKEACAYDPHNRTLRSSHMEIVEDDLKRANTEIKHKTYGFC